MATLAKMGMDNAKKEGGMDQKDIDDLKNFNMDSLTKGLKTLDTVLKKITPEDMEKMKKMGEEMKKQLEGIKE